MDKSQRLGGRITHDTDGIRYTVYAVFCVLCFVLGTMEYELQSLESGEVWVCFSIEQVLSQLHQAVKLRSCATRRRKVIFPLIGCFDFEGLSVHEDFRSVSQNQRCCAERCAVEEDVRYQQNRLSKLGRLFPSITTKQRM